MNVVNLNWIQLHVLQRNRFTRAAGPPAVTRCKGWNSSIKHVHTITASISIVILPELFTTVKPCFGYSLCNMLYMTLSANIIRKLQLSKLLIFTSYRDSMIPLLKKLPLADNCIPGTIETIGPHSPIV